MSAVGGWKEGLDERLANEGEMASLGGRWAEGVNDRLLLREEE